MIKHYFRLVRMRNLAIVALTQYLMRYAVIAPILTVKGYESQFGHLNFALLVLATVLITAAGYAINDYFDAKTDMINRPETVVVGKTIDRRAAMLLHIIFNAAGVALGFYVSFAAGVWKLGFIYIIISALLWFYSSDYKRRFLVGNFIVAFLTALVPLITVLYEIPPLNAHYSEALKLLNDNFLDLTFVVTGFSVFAFITTLTREIIKDVEDVDGDQEYGRQTLPIVFGIKNTRITIISLLVLTSSAIIFVWARYLLCRESVNGICEKYDFISAAYIFVFLVFPLIFLIYKTAIAQEKRAWSFISAASKLLMLAGIVYSIVFYMIYSF